MVPLVKYLAKLKLCNIPGLIIMCVTLASSQGVFLLVNYIRSVPRDLEEAAYIDGCGTVKAYVKIVLPMIKPILASILCKLSIGKRDVNEKSNPPAMLGRME